MNRRLLVAFLFFASGILLASFIRAPITFVLILAILFIAISFFIKKHKSNVSAIFLLASIICIGAACFYNASTLSSNHIANKAQNEEIIIKGIIVSDPLFYETFWSQRRASFVFKAESYKQNGQWIEAEGLCKINLYKADKDYKYAQRIKAFGYLEGLKPVANPGEFDYAGYLRQQNIHAVFNIASDDNIEISKTVNRLHFTEIIKSKIYALRKKINEHIHIYLPEEEAAMVSAIMLGRRSLLPHKSKDLFLRTGTAHILAISGLHLAVIAYVFFFILGLLRIPYKVRAFLVIIVIFFYAILSGGRPSVIRAMIMITMFLLGRILNRDIDTYNTLSIAGILMLLINPIQLFNMGFILSFMCVFALFFITPKIKSSKYVKPLIISFFLYIAIAPIIAYNFNIISPITIIANLFILPFTALLICTSLTFIFFGIIFSALAPMFGQTLWLVAFLLKQTLFYLSKIPYAYFYVPDMPMWYAGIYYLLMAFIIIHQKLRLSLARALIIVLISINAFIWIPPFLNTHTDKLKISFLKVGHGTAIFIQFPDGKTMLVDAAAKTGDRDKGIDIVMPYIWHEGKTRVDCMLITHGHTDHFGGASAVINRADVRHFIYNGVEKGEEGYSALMNLVKTRRIKTFIVKEGDSIDGFSDVEILVFNPPEGAVKDNRISGNDSSIVLKLVYKDISFLLCADILSEGIKNILPYNELLKSNIIYVPHHGSNIGSDVTPILYDLVKPDAAVISASKKYRYTLPDTSTLSTLSVKQIPVFLTDTDGAVIVSTDGKTYDIYTTYSSHDL